MIPHIHFFPFYATCHFHQPPSDTFLSCLYTTYLFIVEQIFILLKRKENKHESIKNFWEEMKKKKEKWFNEILRKKKTFFLKHEDESPGN